MQSNWIALILIIVHLILIAVFMLYAKKTRYVPASYAWWAGIIIIFGPLAGIVAVRESKKKKDYSQLYLIVSGGDAKELYDARRNDTDIVAAEELFIVNDLEAKRKSVLKILVDNKRQYIETIKLAATDPDQETSHYATATIMQVINEFQKNMAELQSLVSRRGSGENELREYIKALNDFLEIQLMDDELMKHYRILLDEALKKAFDKYECDDLNFIYIQNQIKLGNLTEAIYFADRVIAQNREDDRIILARLNLYIRDKDEEGIRAFIAKMHARHSILSSEIREAFAFWEEEASRER